MFQPATAKSSNVVVLKNNARLQHSTPSSKLNAARLDEEALIAQAEMIRFCEGMLDANPPWLTPDTDDAEARSATIALLKINNRLLKSNNATMRANQELLIAIASKLGITI